jgi:hypothetical protein
VEEMEKETSGFADIEIIGQSESFVRTYLKNKIRVQGKARNGEKAEHTRSM